VPLRVRTIALLLCVGSAAWAQPAATAPSEAAAVPATGRSTTAPATDVRYSAMRADAFAAYQRRDYAEACRLLDSYTLRYDRDLEAVRLFIAARLAAELPDNSHLPVALAAMRRLLALDPEDVATRRQLAVIAARVGLFAEALEAADRLLAVDVADTVALAAKGKTLFGMRRPAEAVQALDSLLAISPLAPEPRAIWIEAMLALGRADEILPRTLSQVPEDAPAPAAALARGMARLAIGDREKAAAELKAAARQTPMDGEYLRMLVMAMERAELFYEAVLAMGNAPVALNDSQLRRLLFRRLWEWGAYDVIVRAGSSLDQRIMTDPEVIAIVAMSCAQGGLKERATTLAQGLASRRDSLAVAWSTLVSETSLAPQPPTTAAQLRIIAAARAILSVDASSGLARYHLGEALAATGEVSRALEALQRAHQLSPGWVLPLLRAARLYLDEARTEVAIDLVERAATRLPRDPSVAAALREVAAMRAEAWLADFKRIDEQRRGELLKWFADFQTGRLREPRTMPIYVRLLCASGQKEAARAAINDALGAPQPPPQGVLLQLAAVSRAESLGLEQACLERARAVYGTTPELAAAEARALLEAGQTLSAIELFAQRMASKPAPEPAWRLAWARLLTDCRDQRAVDAWVQLGSDPALARDLTVQLAVLYAPPVQSQPQFLAATIARVRALVGDQATSWRLAQAALLARDSAPDADVRAAKLLGEVVALVPNDVSLRRQLAARLVMAGEMTAAQQQLETAARLSAGNPAIVADLAWLHTIRRDFDRAAAYIQRLEEDLPPSAMAGRVEVAYAWRSLAVESGNPAHLQRARAIVSALAAEHPQNPAILFARATVEAAGADAALAESLYRQVLEHSPEHAATMNNLALLLAERGGDLKQAMDLATRAVRKEPQVASFRDSLASIASNMGDHRLAVEACQAAVAIEPRNLEWRIHLAESLVKAGNKTQAQEELQRIEAFLSAGMPLGPSLRARLERLKSP